jgi:homoserine O-acetyltransferase
MVRAQLALLDHLGIERLHASSGASLGGMQSLLLAAMAPDRVGRSSRSPRRCCSHPQSIALRFVQRQAVMADADWRGGRYYGRSFPHRGQKIAPRDRHDHLSLGPGVAGALRPRAHDEGAVPRPRRGFRGRALSAHQGEKFCLQYDANSYLYISKAMDLFDLTDASRGRPAIERITCPAS